MTHNEHEFINLSRIQAHHITDCLQWKQSSNLQC